MPAAAFQMQQPQDLGTGSFLAGAGTTFDRLALALA